MRSSCKSGITVNYPRITIWEIPHGIKKTLKFFGRGFMDFKQETLQFRQGCNLVSRESHYQCINHVIIYKTDNHVINRYCRQCVEYNYTRILRQVRNARWKTEQNVEGKKKMLDWMWKKNFDFLLFFINPKIKALPFTAISAKPKKKNKTKLIKVLFSFSWK